MYTYNLYCFGLDLTKNEDICNFIEEIIEYSKKINDKTFEISTPYHGGKVAGDLFPVIFGHIISDDDHNTDYITDIKNSKSEDIIDDYNTFKNIVIQELKNDIKETERQIEEVSSRTVNKDQKEEIDYMLYINKLSVVLIDYIKNTEPYFYTMEVSS